MKKSSQVIDLNKQCFKYSYMMSYTFLTFLPKSTGRTLYQPLLEERGERKFHLFSESTDLHCDFLSPEIMKSF